MISGATASSYRLLAADAGRRVQVRVTATASNWDPGTATSAARVVARVPSSTTLALSRTRATTRQRVTATILQLPARLLEVTAAALAEQAASRRSARSSGWREGRPG